MNPNTDIETYKICLIASILISFWAFSFLYWHMRKCMIRRTAKHDEDIAALKTIIEQYKNVIVEYEHAIASYKRSFAVANDTDERNHKTLALQMTQITELKGQIEHLNKRIGDYQEMLGVQNRP